MVSNSLENCDPLQGREFDSLRFRHTEGIRLDEETAR